MGGSLAGCLVMMVLVNDEGLRPGEMQVRMEKSRRKKVLPKFRLNLKSCKATNWGEGWIQIREYAQHNWLFNHKNC